MPNTSASDVTAASRSFAPGGRLFWSAAAAVALILGYADLWRGGETIAPILLVIAYCVLIPIAILKR